MKARFLVCLVLFLGLGIRRASAHGGIYIARVYTAATVFNLFPSVETAQGDKGVNISGLYSWTAGKANTTVVEGSDITGNSLAASFYWQFSRRFAVSVLGSAMTASGLEPRNETAVTSTKVKFTADGYSAIGALVFYPVLREHFQLPVLLGAGGMWVTSYKENALPHGPGAPSVPQDQWTSPAIAFGLFPRYSLKKWSFGVPFTVRRTSTAHDQLKPQIAAGLHSKQDFMDPAMGLNFTYRPLGLSLLLLDSDDDIRSAALQWSRRW